MPIAGRILAGLKPVLRLGNVRRLRRDDEGTTAIEFALVATPFLMFVFALIGCSAYFFTVSSIEKGMDQASRLLRTGEAAAEKLTVAQFRQLICDGAGTWINCNKLQIVAQQSGSWANDPANPPYSCTVNSKTPSEIMKDADPIALYTGGASQIVIVTTCYKWELPEKLPFLKLGNSPDGSMMMQTATAFQSEPWPDN
jgi:Flp pilus assembly protein TadG